MTIEEAILKDGFIVTPVKGTSMLPMLDSRTDRAVIEAFSGKLNKGDVVLYKRKNDTYVLHRLVKTGKKGLVFCGDNHFALEYGVTPDMCLGVLKGYFRGETYVDLQKSRKYKFYKAFYANRRILKKLLYPFLKKRK